MISLTRPAQTLRQAFAWALLLAIGMPGAVTAQAVYRCGQTYQDTPCPEARQVTVDDPRTPQQQAAAQAQLAAAQRRVDAGAQQRRAQATAEARRARATSASPRPEAQAAEPGADTPCASGRRLKRPRKGQQRDIACPGVAISVPAAAKASASAATLNR